MMAANTVKEGGAITLPASYERIFNMALERQGLRGPDETVNVSSPAQVKKELMARVTNLLDQNARITDKEGKVGIDYRTHEGVACVVGEKAEITWAGVETDAALIVLDDVTQYREYDRKGKTCFSAVVGERGGIFVVDGKKAWVEDDDGNRMEFVRKKFSERTVTPVKGFTQEQAEDSCNKIVMAYTPDDGNAWEQALFDEESEVQNDHLEFMHFFMGG